MHRATFFDGLLPDRVTRRPVHLSIGPTGNLRALPGSQLLRDRLDADEVVLLEGIPCTTRLRALFDEMRLAPDEREATVAMDMMAAAQLVSIRQMRGYVDAHAGWNGVPQVKVALDLADERSRSPNETRTRLTWELDAQLPRPRVNQPIWDLNGHFLGTADLFDEEAGVVGEFDGAEHRGARRQTRDAAREDLMRRVGLEYFKVTGLDLPDRPLVAERMLATRARARWLPPHARRWTLQPPPGWTPELCLDDVLALRAEVEAHESARMR